MKIHQRGHPADRQIWGMKKQKERNAACHLSFSSIQQDVQTAQLGTPCLMHHIEENSTVAIECVLYR